METMPMDARRIGANCGLIFAGTGLALAICLLALMQVLPLIARFPFSVVVGAVACLLTAWGSGFIVAPRVADGSNVRASLLGSAVAVISLELGTLMGSLPLFIVNRDAPFGFESAVFYYIIDPIYWLSVYGAVPALLLGMCYGVVVRTVLRKQNATWSAPGHRVT